MSMVREEISSSYPKSMFGSQTLATEKRPVRENIRNFVNRLAYGAAWAMKPERARVLPYVWWELFKHDLMPHALRRLPDRAHALDFGEGLAGVYDRLTPDAALAAYAKGLYPFAHVGPMKWWTPPKRSVLFFQETHLEKNLRRLLRQKKYQVTFDKDFSSVIRACAAPRPGRYHLTWIRPDIIECFTRLHRMGHAHSVEVRDQDGDLVGGIYGLAVGKVFFTESQFFKSRDASKVGFAVLNQHLQHWGFALNDGKNETPHLRQTGFVNVSRQEFEQVVDKYAKTPFMVGPWSIDKTLDVSTWVPAEAGGQARRSVLATRKKSLPRSRSKTAAM